MEGWGGRLFEGWRLLIFFTFRVGVYSGAYSKVGAYSNKYGKFYLHVKENSFSYKWFCTLTRFKKQSKSNSEIRLLNSSLYD